MLFTSRPRSRLDAQQNDESSYQFIDGSAWEACFAYRAFANRWVGLLSATDQLETIQRAKTADSEFDFAAVMLELVTAGMLDGLGYSVKSHPTVSGTTRVPDFLALDPDGSGVAYVEVTTIGASGKSISAGNRWKQIYDAIDKMAMPTGSFLRVKLITSGARSPRLGPFRRNLQEWVNLNLEAARNGRIEWQVALEDWRFEIALYATDSQTTYSKAINMLGPQGGFVSTITDIRYAFDQKAKRYGSLPLPYVLVIGDVHGRSWGRDSITSDLSQALFGDETIRWSGEGDVSACRSANGVLLGRNGPKNQQVSAVLFFPDTGIWGLRNPLHQPLLALNPWADHQVPAAFLAMHRMDVKEESWCLIEGQQVADFLGLPAEWPLSRDPPADQ